jgi:hypothetical protein
LGYFEILKSGYRILENAGYAVSVESPYGGGMLAAGFLVFAVHANDI